ncbi:hypothetical protein ACROYT_G006736 [Oculina patagonica]
MRPSGKSPGEQHIYHTITGDKGSPSSSDLQLEEMLVAMALSDIKEMKENVDTNFEAFKKEAQEIRGYVAKAKSESESMENKLSSSFKRLKNMFFYEDRDTYGSNAIEAMSNSLDRMAIAEMQERQELRQEKKKYPSFICNSLCYTSIAPCALSSHSTQIVKPVQLSFQKLNKIFAMISKMRPSGKSPGEQHIYHTITGDKGSPSSSDLQLEEMLVAMALSDIKEMKENVDTNFEAFKKEAQEIRGYVAKAKSESERQWKTN